MNAIKEIGALITGAGLGAAAMYLFDPDNGHDRRQQMKDCSSDMMERSRHSLQNGSHGLMDHLSGLGHRVGEMGQRLGKSAMAAMPSAEQAEHLVDRARAMVPSRFKRQPAHRSAGGSISLVLAVAGATLLGAGLMYLSDPQSGRRRRRKLADKTHHLAKEAERTAHRMERKARHYRNVAKGYAHDARRHVADAMETLRGTLTFGRSNSPRDEELAARAAAEVENILSAGEVCISSVDGVIELSGRVTQADRDAIEDRVRSVAGVGAIRNELEIMEDSHEPADQNTSA